MFSLLLALTMTADAPRCAHLGSVACPSCPAAIAPIPRPTLPTCPGSCGCGGGCGRLGCCCPPYPAVPAVVYTWRVSTANPAYEVYGREVHGVFRYHRVRPRSNAMKAGCLNGWCPLR